MDKNISLNERADALERKMSDELDVLLSKSALFNMADGKLGASAGHDNQHSPMLRRSNRGEHAAQHVAGEKRTKCRIDVAPPFVHLLAHACMGRPLHSAHFREPLLHPLRCEHVHFAVRQRSVSQLGQCHGAGADP